MISNFGPGDGGRETWAYNFIPRLLDCWPDATLDIIGLRREGKPDHTSRLQELLGSRGNVTFVETRRKRFPILSMLREAPRLSHNHRPDLVISVGSAIEQLVTLLSPNLRKTRRILWLRTILTHERAHQLPRLLAAAVTKAETRLLRSAHLLIANGEDTAAYYRRQGLAVSVISNGVDVERWRTSPPKLEQPVRILFAGRPVPVKGFREFLAVAHKLAGPQFEFHVAGNHAGDGVINHGELPNDRLPELTARMDVCVALTHQSDRGGGGGLSNALLEQMAAGRVIVAWQNGIFTQILNDGNSFLAPQGDVDAMVRLLRAIVRDPEEARRRALKAARDVGQFSFDAHMEKFVREAGPVIGYQT